MISNYVQRVANTAIYDVKGSYTQRNKLATQMNKRIFETLSDEIINKNQVKFGRLAEIIKSFLPGIKVVVKPNRNEKNIAQIGWNISSRSKLLEGFSVELLPKKNKKVVTDSRVCDAMHEIRHLIDYAFNPRFSSMKNRRAYSENFPEFNSRVDKYEKFYDSFLYADDMTYVQKERFHQNPELEIKRRKIRLDKAIRGFMPKEASSQEKIKMLQGWRYSLMSEKNAYKDDITYENEMEFLKKKKTEPSLPKSAEKELREKIKNEVYQKNVEKFFFDEKIKILKTIIKEEIAGHRREHAKQLRASLAN